MKTIVYKATNLINNKVYIGITSTSLELRRSRHYHDSNRKETKRYFQKALKKYSKNDFVWEILFVAFSWKDAQEIEKLFINQYQSFNHEYGYNLTLGGDGVLGHSHIPWNKGKKNWMTDNHKNAFENSKKQLIPWNKNKQMTKEYCLQQQKSSLTKKSVIGVDLNSGFLHYFPSVKSASKQLNIAMTNIHRNLKDPSLSYNNFTFISEEGSWL